MYEELREAVCQANIALNARNLVICNWGNLSGIDRTAGVIAIKPSGVPYDKLTGEQMVLLDLDGNVIEGNLRPSSDTPTHIELYRSFETTGSVCHTHSTSATMWAQACKPIPCFGTTHADYFYGEIPVTDSLTEQEIKNDYELNTGKVIARRFEGMDPLQMPAVLVANHGPFTWGKSPADSVEAAFVLEQVAKMALGTIMINSNHAAISQKLLDKHYLRKHGANAYYGQE